MQPHWKLCLLALSFMLVAAPAQADKQFSNADLRGPYGWSLEGTIIETSFEASVDVVRQFTADGQGTFSATGMANIRSKELGNQVVPHTLVCSYSVEPNGIGTATCNSPELGPEKFAFVLIDEGKEARFISTTPGVIIKGVARRQRR